MSNINSKRICVQEILPQHQDHFNHILDQDHSDEYQKRLAAAFYTQKLWPKDSKIRIGFLDTPDKITITSEEVLKSKGKELDPLQKQINNDQIIGMIKKIVKERIIPLVNLDIDFVDNPSDANVRISFDPNGGSWSLVGTDHLHKKSGATMNLGWFDVPTTIHEFGHVLGMIHEHQNPRGESILWNRQKVYEWAKVTQGWNREMTDKNILDKYDMNMINGSNFDPNSIMLYFFPADLTINNKGTHENLRLSGLDVMWMSQMYPNKNGETPNKFYEMVYGENIENSIKDSEEKAKKMNSKSSKTPYIIIGILSLMIVVYLIYFRVKNRTTRRYYLN